MFVNRMPRFEVLDEDAVATLERGWRRILTDVGVAFGDPEAIALLRAAGQRVEGDVAFLDPEFVLEQVALAPTAFELQARNAEQSVHVGGDAMVFASVYGCPFVREGEIRREATMDDFERLVKLSHAFPQIDTPGGVICEPGDRPLDSRHLDMTFALQTLSDKPYFGSVTSGLNARDSIRMTEILFGGGGEIEALPALLAIVNVNSPLRYDERMLAALMEYARAGQAPIITPFLLMGAMAPVSIPAAIAQQTAEAFAGIALAQLVRPGCPVVLGSFLSFRPSNRPWDRRTFANWRRIQRFRRLTARDRSDAMVYPHALRFDRHAEFGCHGLIPTTTFDDLASRLEEARRFGGDFCVATHYWEIDDGLKQVLMRFLAHASGVSGARFVPAEELFAC